MKASSVPLPDNAVAAMVYYKKQPRTLWIRRLTIFNSFFSFCILLIWDWLTGNLSKNQQLRANTLRQKLIRMGPTFIKLGQFLSCRPDIMPLIYLQELANLQDQLPPFPNEQAYQVIEEEFGCPYHQIYVELAPQPVASASLGQVYKGKLKTGEIVAVKVQRLRLSEQIALDIYLLRQLAAWLQNLSFIYSDLIALSDELARHLFAEIDYIQEGLNAEKFAQLYGELQGIQVPRIHLQYTKRRVLTMEWVDGIKLTSTEAIRAQGLEPNELITIGFKFSLQQLLKGGFFHADPHPGNVLVTADGKLAYLDFGMMSEIPPDVCDLLIITLLHLISGDFAGLAQDYILLEFLPPETDIAPLIPKLAEIFGNIKEASIGEFGFKQSFNKLLALIHEYAWQTPTIYLLIFRCFATLEGVALKVNPNFQVYKVAYPDITRWLLTKRSPLLWDALRNFYLKNQAIQWKLISDLLANTYQSDELKLKDILEYLLEFLYSPQGNSLRYVLINEIVTNLEISQNTFEDVIIWMKLIITSYLPLNLITLCESSQLFFKPEFQRLAQEIVNKLVRRLLSHLMPKQSFKLV